MRSFHFYYDFIYTVGNTVERGVCHPDDIEGFRKRLSVFKQFIKNGSTDVSLLIKPVFSLQMDLFRVFDLIDKLYADLCELTDNYSVLSPEFQKEFPEEELVKFRKRLFNVSLLNKF